MIFTDAPIVGHSTPESRRIEEIDPLALIRDLWPKYRLSREQKQMIVSVWQNIETIVPAGNQLGKDFVTGLIVLVFFITRKPCRILITSANEKHLNVLRTEMARHCSNSRIPLTKDKGGPLRVTRDMITREENGVKDDISYIQFAVFSPDKPDAMAGHHAYPDNLEEASLGLPYSLAVADEASSVRDECFDKLKSWCKRLLIIGNPYPCENYFKHAVKGKPGTDDKGGDIPRENGLGYKRKIIRVRAVDSPNIRYALAQKAMGMKESDGGFAPLIIPGLRDYETYKLKLQTLDKILRCVQLEADFYEGAELKLWPVEWLAHCSNLAAQLRFRSRIAKSLGIDTAEGGDKTAFVAGDEFGILEVLSLKTPDTNIIPAMVKAMGRKWNIPSENWIFDRGGGGKVHADRLRSEGYPVRTIAFNSPPSTSPPKKQPKGVREKVETYEDRTIYKNVRAEMYYELSLRCNPTHPLGGYGIPLEGDGCIELHRQLSYMPKLYGSDGEMYMLPKNKKSADAAERTKTLTEILGCSPDEADAAVLMYWGIMNQVRVGVGSASLQGPRPVLIPK